MDSRSEDHLGTLIKCNQYLKDDAPFYAGNPAVAALRTTLDADITSIYQNDSTAVRPLEGFTDFKRNARNTLVVTALHVRAACKGYYTLNPDPRKYGLVNFPDSKMEGARDNDVYVIADQVHDVADPIKNLLTPWQVAAADVDSIPVKAQAYRDAIPGERTEEGINKAAHAEVQRLIFVKSFQETDPKGTLILLDAHLSFLPYVDNGRAIRWATARMIDDSGGGSGTDGYSVQGYELAPHASVSFGPVPAPDKGMYLRQVGGAVGVLVCVMPLATDVCVSGLTLVPNTTLKKTAAENGLTGSGFIIFTNPGNDTVTVRAGLKTL